MKVWLDVVAKDVIEREARNRRFVETGGPLFGYRGGETEDLVVVAAFGPGPDAKHRPRSLVPDRAATDRAIREVHARSEGRYRYVGSWHTHPLGQARPSGIDKATAREISTQEDVDLRQPLLLIQATRPTRWTVGIGPLGSYLWNAREDSLDAVGDLETVDMDDRLVTSSTGPYPGLVLASASHDLGCI